MPGSNRAIDILKLFTLDCPDWTVEQFATALNVSSSSAYRYVATLEGAGLLTTVAHGHYTLGPAIIQYDRQIQLTDPLLKSARPVMLEIIGYAPVHSRVVLCRRFRDTLLCVDQLANGEPLPGVTYERGRPLPYFKGATSKVILAYQTVSELQRLHRAHQAEIAAANLGTTWLEFRNCLAAIRKAGHVIAYAEVDAERIGIAAPILDPSMRVIAGLSYVISMADKRSASHLAAIVVNGSRQVETSMRLTPSDEPGS